MDAWEFLIGAVAFLLAFRSLALLMAAHKKHFQERTLVEELARRKNAERETAVEEDAAGVADAEHAAKRRAA